MELFEYWAECPPLDVVVRAFVGREGAAPAARGKPGELPSGRVTMTEFATALGAAIPPPKVKHG